MSSAGFTGKTHLLSLERHNNITKFRTKVKYFQCFSLYFFNYAVMFFFMRLIAFFSRRDTCACDMPTSLATSICVRPS